MHDIDRQVREPFGLTTEQVRQRQARGQVNRVALTTSRPLGAILRGNLFTLFNGILAGAVLLLVVVDQYRDAVLISTLVIFSVGISVAQEIRAKRQLDQIALIAQPHARVIRDGREQAIRPSEVVLDDCLVIAPGEQVVADGTLVRADALEMDESLLTGEVEPVPKVEGDTVRSGSFCVAGSGVYVATQVGEASYVQSLTAAARHYRNVRTPLQQFLDRILKVLLVVVVSLSVFQAIVFVIQGVPIVDAVRGTAVIATLVPQGLLVMSTAAYSLGALRLARHDGLVQQLNAVESLSHVDVLGTDKTGTLTRSRLIVRELIPLGGDIEEMRQLVGTYAASVPERNTTLRAIAAHFPASACEVRAQVPFRSERKWGSLTVGKPYRVETYVLGAPEVLLPHADTGDGRLAETIEGRAKMGQRVLLFARAPSAEATVAADGQPRLPSRLEPLALIVLEEDLREDAPATLRAFAQQGVTLKIISGDHPQTVLALARRAGLPPSTQAISGVDLAKLAPADFAATVERTTVFGRITPGQKQQIVAALKDDGHYVAMIGDGVNDILALKEAQLGIAVQSGSPATRSVADMVLLNDSFTALPAALQEGRRIVNAMDLLIKLFLVRDVATIELILVTGLFGVPFPLLPPQVTIVALLTVGIPSLFLVAWAVPKRPEREQLEPILKVVLPLGSAVGLATIVVYVLMLLGFDADVSQARTAVVTAAVVGGLVALLFLCHPWTEPLANLLGDRRLLLLVLLLLVAYLVVLYLPAFQRTFELSPLTPGNWLAVLASASICLGGLRLAARNRLLGRLVS